MSDDVPALVAGIARPVIPAAVYPITEYGARPGPGGDGTAAVAAAIAAAHAAGGGRVLVPPGEWSTGPIHLRSRVELHLARGATLRFIPEPGRYLPAVPTRWEGLECLGYSPLVYAHGCADVALTGEGVLDGGADHGHWWPWKGRASFGWQPGAPHQGPARDRLIALAEAGVPAAERCFAEESCLRPMFVQFHRCRRVLVEGVTLRRSPMWCLHPVLCTHVTVRGVTFDSHGPNNDGCNPESCREVLIEDCVFDTGDDCIALKSGRNADGRRLAVPTERVVIRRCVMRDGHGGVVVGSEVSGGCRDVFVEDCEMSSPRLERALRIKTNSHRGGIIERIYLRRIRVGEVSDAVVRINFHYEEGSGGPHAPVVRDIELEDVVSRRSEFALFLAGYPDAPIRGVRLRRCHFGQVRRPSMISAVADLVLEDVRQDGHAPLAELFHDEN
jgi:polygalacturonase